MSTYCKFSIHISRCTTANIQLCSHFSSLLFLQQSYKMSLTLFSFTSILNNNKPFTSVHIYLSTQLWIRKLSYHPSGWVIAYVRTRDDGRSIKFITSLDKFKSQMYTISGYKFEILDVFTGEKFNVVKLTEKFTISINPSGIMMFRIIPFQLTLSSK